MLTGRWAIGRYRRYNRRMVRALLPALVLVLLASLPARAQAPTDGPPADYPGPSPEAAREALDFPVVTGPGLDTAAELERILSQPDFQEAGADSAPSETWLEKFLRWFQQRFGGRSAPGSSPGWTTVIAVLVGVVLVIYLLTRLVWWLMGWRRDRGPTAAEDDGPARHLSPDGLDKLAGEAAGRGDHRGAVRYRYLALLKRLDMPESPLRTNSQVRRWIDRKHPLALDGFTALAGCYEDAWYGGLPCGAEDYDQARGHAAAVEERVAADQEREAAEQGSAEVGDGP